MGYTSRGAMHLFLLCWLAYFATYVCRLNYSAVMPELLADGYSESRLGTVLSAFLVCYGLGQIVSGWCSDKFSSRSMIFLGLLLSGTSNIAVCFFGGNYTALLLLWMFNSVVQSMVWSPLLHIAGEWLNPDDRRLFGYNIATTSPAGTIVGYGIALLVLLVLPWKYVFLCCGALTATAAFVWWFGTGRVLSKMPRAVEVEQTEAATKRTETVVPMRPLVGMMATAGVLLMLIPIVMQGTLKDSVTNWIPTFLSGSFEMSTSLSLALTMILPLINVLGSYAAKAVERRLHNELYTAAVFFGIAGVCLTVLALGGYRFVPVAVVCLAGVTSSMVAVNVMYITMVPLRFARFGRTGTVGGILDAVAYIGSGALGLVPGFILEHTDNSWMVMFIIWVALALIAIAVTLLCNRFWKKFIA